MFSNDGNSYNHIQKTFGTSVTKWVERFG